MPKDITSGAYNLAFYFAMFWISGLTAFTGAVPPFVQMVADAICLLYIGSYMSLKFFSFVTQPKGAAAEKALSMDEGWKMPAFAAVTLVGLFVLFKYIGKNYVNYLLVAYFSYLGMCAVKTWIDTLTKNLRILKGLRDLEIVKVDILRYCPCEATFSLYDIIAYIASAALAGVYIYFRDWISNNIIGAAFCLYGFENIYIGKFTTAFLMLGLFFAYDIYFVFGTSIMVTVAMGVDGPIKLVFPRVVDTRASMLGLGDILVPGLLLTLCLRFDLAQYLRKRTEAGKEKVAEAFPKSSTDFPKPYYMTCFIGYVIGLIVTIAVGVMFNAAQPALLYLVPLTVIPVSTLALVRGDIKHVFSYDEEEEAHHLKEIIKKQAQ